MASWRLLFFRFSLFYPGPPHVPHFQSRPWHALSPLATRVMLLGSGELGKEVVIALQRLGVEVIAVDRYADAPGSRWRTAPTWCP